MKKLIACATLIGMLLCGCSSSNPDLRDRFVVVGNYGLTRSIFVDTETNVLYLRFDRGVTVLLNADGTPMLWGE